MAVDPGLTCGWAVLIGTDFESGEGPGLPVVSMVERFARAGGLVVYESFIPLPGIRTWQPDALEIIGAIKYVCYLNGIKPEHQSPANAKRFSTNAKLKALGWRHPTPGGHADDAARHLLLSAVRHGVINPTELIAR